MCPRRAGRHHHAVQPVFFNQIDDLPLGLGGAGKHEVRGEHHVGKFLSRRYRPIDIHHAGDIGAAMAHKNPDSGNAVDGLLRHRCRGDGFRIPGRADEDGGFGGSGTGLDDRFRDVLGRFGAAAHKNTLSGGGDRCIEFRG